MGQIISSFLQQHHHNQWRILRNIDSLCFLMSFMPSFILFSPVNEHVALDNISSVARKQCSDCNLWLQLWSAPDNPQRKKSGISVATCTCADHVPPAHLAQYCCSCPQPQQGKVLSMNFHSSWPITSFSWTCCGEYENRNGYIQWKVSLSGMTFPCLIAPIQHSLIRHICTSDFVRICNALWGSKV